MSLLNSLRIVASAYGNKYGVTVIPDNVAFTNGKKIHTVIDEQNPEATWGFLCHESAHIRYTSFRGIKDLDVVINQNDKLKGFSSSHLFSLINALEDSRIEYRFFNEYCGSFDTFDRMNAKLIAEGLWCFIDTKSVVESIYQFAGVYAAGSVNGLAYPSCKRLSELVEANLKSLIGKGDFNKIKAIVLKAVTARSTNAIIKLAVQLLEIIADLKEAYDKQQEQANAQAQIGDQEQSQSADSDQGQGESQRQGSEQAQGDGQAQGSQPGQGSGQAQGGEAGQGSSQAQDGESGQGNGQAQGETSDQGESQGSGQSSNGKPSSSNSSDGSSSKPINLDEIPLITDKGDLMSSFLDASPTAERIEPYEMEACAPKKPVLGDHTDRYQRGIEASGKLIRRVNNLLEARRRSKTNHAKTGRKISRRKISRIPAGVTNVFARKKEGIDSNTAIYVTTDVSGSMQRNEGGSSRMDVALEALSALIYAVSKNKGSGISLTTFSNDVHRLKTFEEPMTKVKALVNGLSTLYSTDLAPALWTGIKDIATVKNKYNRHVMLAITDGQPSDIVESASVVKKAKEANIEVYGIGIFLDMDAERKVQAIFGNDNFILIQKAEDLQNEIIKLAHVAL